jgi:hypothetical protein
MDFIQQIRVGARTTRFQKGNLWRTHSRQIIGPDGMRSDLKYRCRKFLFLHLEKEEQSFSITVYWNTFPITLTLGPSRRHRLV